MQSYDMMKYAKNDGKTGTKVNHLGFTIADPDRARISRRRRTSGDVRAGGGWRRLGLVFRRGWAAAAAGEREVDVAGGDWLRAAAEVTWRSTIGRGDVAGGHVRRGRICLAARGGRR